MTTTDFELLRRRRTALDYHLGRLSEEQTEAVEAEYFADPAIFALFDSVADELVDDYLDGRLDGQASARIDALAAAPDWRERLRFARALRAVAREAPDAAGDAPSLIERLTAMLRTPAWQAGAGLLAAAALIVAVGASLQTRRELVDVRTQLQDTAAARDRAESTARSSETRAAEAQSARESLARQLESLTSVAVMLVPGTRSGAQSVVRVPPAAALVRVTAVHDDPLPANLVAARFELRRGGVQVAGGAVPLAAVSRSDGAVEMQVPAAALTAGEHELRLDFATEPGRFVTYSSFTFSVVR